MLILKRISTTHETLLITFTGTGLAALMTAYKMVHQEVPAQKYFIIR
jgi:hypothetical protein